MSFLRMRRVICAGVYVEAGAWCKFSPAWRISPFAQSYHPLAVDGICCNLLTLFPSEYLSLPESTCKDHAKNLSNSRIFVSPKLGPKSSDIAMIGS